MLRNLLPVTLLLLSTHLLTAQTFESSVGDIQDTGCEAFEFDLSAAELPNEEDGNGTATLLQVCIDITHPNVEDLLIFLTNPNGITVELSLENGGANADYSGTCFSSTAATSIADAMAPFAGEFLPEGDFETLNDGLSPNSAWAIRICDINPDSEGTLNSAQLVFASVLPVKLSQFSANEDRNKNVIKWSTTSEINVASHTVLKSDDTQNWVPVSTVEGQVNSYSTKSYEVFDARPFGITYYKLASTDIDGSIEYSSMVSVNRTSNAYSHIKASPVPAHSIVNINITASSTEVISLTTIDMGGRTILEDTRIIEKGNNQLPVDLSNLTNGVYIISLKSNEINETVRVIKN